MHSQMGRLNTLLGILELAAHDSFLLQYFSLTLDTDSIFGHVLGKAPIELGGLPQNYFYLVSKFAKVIFTTAPVDILPDIEIAQCMRLELLICIQEHREHWFVVL